MTVYNSAATIKSALASALAQNYSKFEMVVLDDGSTDETETICRGFSDPRLRYVKRNRLGRSKALNEAISLAQGEYIAIHDADDLSHPLRLGYSISVMTSFPEIDIMGTNHWETTQWPAEFPPDWHLPENKNLPKPTPITPERIYRSNLVVHSSAIFKKKIWNAIGGYDENLSMCEDYDFLLRALPLGKLFYFPQPTVLQYLNPRSYFRNRGKIEYLKTLWFIKRRVRKQMRFPLWTRLFDVLPLYLVTLLWVGEMFKNRGSVLETRYSAK